MECHVPNEKLFERITDLKGKIIVVEGIIGAGKSTFCKVLAKSLESVGIECVLYNEPINENYLNLYLKDMKKYAFVFQTLMLKQRVAHYKKALEDKQAGKTVIMDRSIYGDMAFELLVHRHGNMNDEEHMVYLSEITKNGIGEEKPDIVIYLDVTVDVAKRRMLNRNRPGEVASYDDEYNKHLLLAYESIMNCIAKQTDRVRVHNIPYNVDCTSFMTYGDNALANNSDEVGECIKTMILLWSMSFFVKPEGIQTN